MLPKSDGINRHLDIKVSLLIALGLSFLLVFFPIWKDLLLTWYNSDDYSHGFFIVPLVVFALWQKREDLSRLPVQSSSLGFALLVFSLVLYILAFYAEIKTFASLAMIFCIVGAVFFLFGRAISREIAFILFFLFFMIPIPAQIYSAMTIPLQLLVSKVSVWLVMLFGLPVFREGNVIHLPDRTLEVVQACSGLRSLMTLMTLSLVISYFTLRSNKLRLLLVMSGLPVAIAVNIFRVLIMIVAFYYFKFDLTEGQVHTIFGIVVFTLAIALLFMIKGVLALWDIPEIKKS